MMEFDREMTFENAVGKVHLFLKRITLLNSSIEDRFDENEKKLVV